MSYTDAEMMMATQVAYLDFDKGNYDQNANVGDVVDRVLHAYGTYDSATGKYVMKDGVSGAAKSQFETAQKILKLSEQNNVASWRHWKVVDSCNNQNTTGYYGCLIDTGDGNAIIGCRGSESYNSDQAIKDWLVADVGRLNNEQTYQQADATEYMKYLYDKYGDSYDSYSFTGHSLGGSLATHAAITAPPGMQDRIDKVISYDGPGFSNEYLAKYEKEIREIRDKLNHYEYSWVGNLLIQPPGINNRVIKAHDDTNVTDIFRTQLFRHDTQNVEFDRNGNVIDGERGMLQKGVGPLSRLFEISPIPIQCGLALRFLCAALSVYILSVGDQIFQHVEEMAEWVTGKLNELYNAYVSFVVSGDYEIHTGEICQMSDDLNSLQRRLNTIADQVAEIKRNLPYDSASAYYYKYCLGRISNALESEGKKANKIARTADKAIEKYNRSDQKVSALF